MNFTLIFLLRLGGVLLIGAGCGAFLVRETWGEGAVLALSWSVFWAFLLGVIGFRSLKKTMLAPPEKLAGSMLTGLLLRCVILIASHYAVFAVIDDEWGRRTLTATVLLYMLALGVEVVTLNGALRSGVFRSQGSPASGSAPSASEGTGSSGGVGNDDAPQHTNMNAPPREGGAREGNAGP